MQKIYRKRRDCLTACLENQFGSHVQIGASASGMNLIASFDDIEFTEEVCSALLDCGVYAVPVYQQSCSEKNYRNALILRYSGLTEDELCAGVTRLTQALSL